MTRRLSLFTALVLGFACSEASAPVLPVGDFAGSITVAGTRYAIAGDSAVWVSTGRGLFNTQIIIDTLIPGAPVPVTLFIGLQDSALAGAPLPPGLYQVSASDTTLPFVSLFGLGFQTLPDSGTLTVLSPRSDSLFEGKVKVWVHDTSTIAPTAYTITARFAAVPFH
jgi:hypothetical protein